MLDICYNKPSMKLSSVARFLPLLLVLSTLAQPAAAKLATTLVEQMTTLLHSQ